MLLALALLKEIFPIGFTYRSALQSISTEYGDPLSRQVLETLPLEQYHKTIILADQDKDLATHSTTTTAMFIRHIQVPLP